MSTTPGNPPRFLPTLTEVVHLSAVEGRATSAAQPARAMPDIQATVGAVMQRVDLLLERRLAEELATLLRIVMTEQLHRVSADLRQDLELLVHQAVSEAMAPWADQQEPK